MAGMRNKLNQRADFAVRSQPLWALDQPDRSLGKLALQLYDRRRRRILQRRDPEQQFVLPPIALTAMTAESFHHPRVDPFE